MRRTWRSVVPMRTVPTQLSRFSRLSLISSVYSELPSWSAPSWDPSLRSSLNSRTSSNIIKFSNRQGEGEIKPCPFFIQCKKLFTFQVRENIPLKYFLRSTLRDEFYNFSESDFCFFQIFLSYFPFLGFVFSFRNLYFYCYSRFHFFIMLCT